MANEFKDVLRVTDVEATVAATIREKQIGICTDTGRLVAHLPGGTKKYYSPDGAATNIDGSGTADYIPKFSDTNTLTDSIMSENATGIGINKASPSAVLHIYEEDAILNTYTDFLYLEHASTGTATTNFGAAIRVSLEDQYGDLKANNRIICDWSAPSNATAWKFNAYRYDTGSTVVSFDLIGTANVIKIEPLTNYDGALHIHSGASYDAKVNYYNNTTLKQSMYWDSSDTSFKLCDQNTTLKIGHASASIGFYGSAGATRAAHIANPAGGGTIDAEARTAINAILVVLENLNLTATS